MLYMDVLQRYLMTTPLTPPTFSLPSPAPLQFALAAPPLRTPPNEEAVATVVLQHPELRPLIDKLTKLRLKRRKKRKADERTHLWAVHTAART